MDSILEEGDLLYYNRQGELNQETEQSHDYLLISDLPTHVHLNDMHIILTYVAYSICLLNAYFII